MLEVRMTPTMGRGVFTLVSIPKGALIAEEHLLVIPIQDQDNVLDTIIEQYHYLFGEEESAIALGFCSLINHSNRPNCEFEIDEERKVIVLTAKKPIRAGAQLFINYGWEENNF